MLIIIKNWFKQLILSGLDYAPIMGLFGRWLLNIVNEKGVSSRVVPMHWMDFEKLAYNSVRMGLEFHWMGFLLAKYNGAPHPRVTSKGNFGSDIANAVEMVRSPEVFLK